MKYQIANELPGRLRVKLAGPVPPADLDALYRVLGACPDIAKSTVYPRIGSVALVPMAGRAIWLSCLLLGVSFCLMFLKEDIEELEQLERMEAHKK